MRNNTIENTNVNEEVRPTERFWITDESQQFVDENAIRLVGNKEYIYLSYPQIQKAYTDESRAYAALFQLRNLNDKLNMNHTFTMNYEELQPKPRYIILDQNGNFVDENSIYILSNEDGYKGSHWRLCTYSSTLNGCFMYHTSELADMVLAKLNALKEIAGFKVEFHVEQYLGDCKEPAVTYVWKMPIVYGKATLHKKLYREIVKQYMN